MLLNRAVKPINSALLFIIQDGLIYPQVQQHWIPCGILEA